jgi:hypothetical protein
MTRVGQVTVVSDYMNQVHQYYVEHAPLSEVCVFHLLFFLQKQSESILYRYQVIQ